MKSFCVKTNNVEIQDYLLNNLADIGLEDVYFIKRKFKIYHNIIIHYKGLFENDFINQLSTIITNCILLFFENNLIDRALKLNYFYFDDFERKIIKENCYNYISSDEDNSIKHRKEEIFTEVLHYINEYKSMILDGFVNFRISNYISTIDNIVDYSVNKYIIEKEYNEFISLLKLYVNSKESNSDLVHIIYKNGESILLNKDKEIINIDDNIFNTKYLSDISFSSNDYTLNSLLTLLPKKINIHIIDYEDDFINTLKLVFGSRIFICLDCSICKIYKSSTTSKKI